MEKKIIYVLVLCLYCFLFYQQAPGINFMLFSLVLIALSLWQKPSLLKEPHWLYAAAGMLASALAIVFVNSSLSVAAHILCIVFMLGTLHSRQLSVYIALVQGVAASFVPFFLSMNRAAVNFANQPQGQKSSRTSLKRSSGLLLPLLVTAGFYFLYSLANPAFGNVVHWPTFTIPADFISFAIFGAIWLKAAFDPYHIEPLSHWDHRQSNILYRIRHRTSTGFDMLALKAEKNMGLCMLILLNALLFSFILFDASFIFSGQILPKGQSYSQYVHNGVNTLIISIILAITVLLYLFRGNLSFYKNNLWLRRLCYLWLLQNFILGLSIVYKNQLYVLENGLTYKRIGVYVYVLLTVFGLISTFLKIAETKSIWYIFRKNALFAYLVLLTAALINWDSQIAHYNINKAKKLDVLYLLNLSDRALPQLNGLLKNPAIQLNKKVEDRMASWGRDGYPILTEAAFIHKRLQIFKQKQAQSGWQSYNIQNEQILKAIER